MADGPSPVPGGLDAFLPRGLFAGRLLPRRALLGALAMLVFADGAYWHGALFGGPAWRIVVRGLTICGLGIGGWSYWRRKR